MAHLSKVHSFDAKRHHIVSVARHFSAVKWLFMAIWLLIAQIPLHAETAKRQLLGNPPATTLAASSDAQFLATYSSLRQKIAKNGSVPVIVGLRVPFAPEGYLNSVDREQQRAEIEHMASRVLPSIVNKSLNKIGSKFSYIPYVFQEVDEFGLQSILDNDDVISIFESKSGSVNLTESVPLIGSVDGRFSGFSGAGQVIAILDSGVDKLHPDLHGKVVSEACFSTVVAGSSDESLCPEGVSVSTALGSAMPYIGGVCPAGKCDHGTHVASIATGGNGVARNANIIAIQVAHKSSSSGIGNYDKDVIAALGRVLELKGVFNISAVNVSLGFDVYLSQNDCDRMEAPLKVAIDNLKSYGVAVVASSGNDGYIDRIKALHAYHL